MRRRCLVLFGLAFVCSLLSEIASTQDADNAGLLAHFNSPEVYGKFTVLVAHTNADTELLDIDPTSEGPTQAESSYKVRAQFKGGDYCYFYVHFPKEVPIQVSDSVFISFFAKVETGDGREPANLAWRINEWNGAICKVVKELDNGWKFVSSDNLREGESKVDTVRAITVNFIGPPVMVAGEVTFAMSNIRITKEGMYLTPTTQEIEEAEKSWQEISKELEKVLSGTKDVELEAELENLANQVRTAHERYKSSGTPERAGAFIFWLGELEKIYWQLKWKSGIGNT